MSRPRGLGPYQLPKDPNAPTLEGVNLSLKWIDNTLYEILVKTPGLFAEGWESGIDYGGSPQTHLIHPIGSDYVFGTNGNFTTDVSEPVWPTALNTKVADGLGFWWCAGRYDHLAYTPILEGFPHNWLRLGTLWALRPKDSDNIYMPDFEGYPSVFGSGDFTINIELAELEPNWSTAPNVGDSIGMPDGIGTFTGYGYFVNVGTLTRSRRLAWVIDDVS